MNAVWKYDGRWRCIAHGNAVCGPCYKQAKHPFRGKPGQMFPEAESHTLDRDDLDSGPEDESTLDSVEDSDANDLDLAEGIDEPGQTDALLSYKMNYRGGHPDYPKPKVSGLSFGIYPDRFELQPTNAAKKWFRGLSIPYSQVRDVQIVARNVGTAEALLGGLNSRQLNQDNNIHIAYDADGHSIVLRLEMLTGVSVMGQAKKCRELEDRLRNLGIREKFSSATPTASAVSSTGGILDQIATLASLRSEGILSDDEFEAKKTELLGRL